MESNEKKKAKLVFAKRLAPKVDGAERTERTAVGIPVSSELQARLPVVVAAGRTRGYTGN